MFDIDYVFPYVNNNDPVWRRSYIDYCRRISNLDRINKINGERYEDLGLLPYLILCIEKNLPWIRKIHLIISNKEQVPDILREDPKIHIVLHKDMMPESTLPTFNSTSIEMYLRRIPDLAEHFIYGNDDMFPINELQPTDFFSEDGSKIKINFHVSTLKSLSNQFRKVCYNNNKTLLNHYDFKSELKDREYYRPLHSITPMIKSHCVDILEKCGSDIFRWVSAFRTDKQHNQYIYPVYEKLTNNTIDSNLIFKYVSYKNTLDNIIENILDPTIDIICINDTSGTNRFSIINGKSKIIDAFKRRLELSDN